MSIAAWYGVGSAAWAAVSVFVSTYAESARGDLRGVPWPLTIWNDEVEWPTFLLGVLFWPLVLTALPAWFLGGVTRRRIEKAKERERLLSEPLP